MRAPEQKTVAQIEAHDVLQGAQIRHIEALQLTID